MRMKDLFTMTRHERMGTIAILVIVAVLLLGTLLLRQFHTDSVNPQLVEDARVFEAEVDSVTARSDETVPSVQKAKKAPKSRKKKSGSSKPEPKRHPVPRRMDPVPQF